MSFALWIYNPLLEHPQARGSGLPANTWVEVIHNAFSMDGDATWFYYAPGTAVYMYTGNTRVYSDHDDATADLLKQACNDNAIADSDRPGESPGESPGDNAMDGRRRSR